MNTYNEKLGVSTSHRFDKSMDYFVKKGVNCLEFRVIKGDDRRLIQSQVDLVMKEKNRLGFEVYTIHLPQMYTYDLSLTDDFARLKALQNQKEIVNMLLPLGAKICVLHPDAGTVPECDYDKRHKALIKSLKDFAPWCKERGLMLAIENLTQISSFQTSSHLMEVVEAVGDNIGICFDVNHNFKESHRDFINNAGKHIITMHISDNDGVQERHYLPGKGVINFGEIIAMMNELGYKSSFIFECAGVMESDDLEKSSTDLIEHWEAQHK